VRQDLPLLVEKLSALKGLKDLCLTTNGALLSERIQALNNPDCAASTSASIPWMPKNLNA